MSIGQRPLPGDWPETGEAGITDEMKDNSEQPPAARRIETIGRWSLVAVLAAGGLFWWHPGYRNWAGVLTVLSATWVVWLVRQVLRGDRTLSGHPIWLALAAPAAAMSYHLVRDLPLHHAAPSAGLGGAVDVSLLLQVAMLGLTVMLGEELLGGGQWGRLASAGAMAAAPALTLLLAESGAMTQALTAVSAGGWLLLAAAMWRCARSAEQAPPPKAVRAAAALAGLVGLATLAACPAAGVEAGLAMLAALALSAAVLRWRRVVAAPVVLIFAVSAVLRVMLGPPIWRATFPMEPAGLGEQVLAHVYAGDSGLDVLLAAAGPLATAWAVLAALGGGVWLVSLLPKGAARTPGMQGPAVLWLCGTAAVSSALLLEGGLFCPLALLATGVAWSQVPAMAGRAGARRSGWWAAGAFAALTTAMGLTAVPGLAQWASSSWGRSEDFLHVPTGFFLSLLLGWLLGRRWWGAAAGVTLGALAGGAGELAQWLLSRRGVEGVDWLLHAAGSAGAAVVLALAWMAKGRKA